MGMGTLLRAAWTAFTRKASMEICTVQELHQRMEEGHELLLLDVRTPRELAAAAIPGAVNIPLNELERRLHEINDWREREIVAICHHGPRSGMAQALLLRSGFSRVYNLRGGIDAYAAQVAPEIPRY